MSPVAGDTPAGRAYFDLQAKARADGRQTSELIQLYVLEGFLVRLARSTYRDQLVLKGGVLLAAFGIRRPTRDVDLAGLDLPSDQDHIREVITNIASINIDDGLDFDTSSVTAVIIRDQDEYSGVRVTMSVNLSTAEVRFHVDLNVGDPVWPSPLTVAVPRLLGGDDVRLLGYPLHMVHAEKIITAAQRGTANTRWRDFADVWNLSRAHPIVGFDLQRALQEVAKFRRADLSEPLEETLDDYGNLAQAKWAPWRRKQNLLELPEQFADLLVDFVKFSQPPLSRTVTDKTWDPRTRTWV